MLQVCTWRWHIEQHIFDDGELWMAHTVSSVSLWSLLQQTSLLYSLWKIKLKKRSEKKKKKVIWNTKGTKSTNTKFPNHTEYTYSTTLKNACWVWGSKNIDSYKDYWKHTVVHTEGGDTTGQQREREGCREKSENERTASRGLPNDGQILQNILLTIFTRITGSGQICVRNSQQTPCAFE